MATVAPIRQQVQLCIGTARQVALGKDVGLRANELDDIAAGFEHKQMEATAALIGR